MELRRLNGDSGASSPMLMAASKNVLTRGITEAEAADVEFAECDCCGLREECTLQYIAGVRERYQGRWICGLCAEAVKDESLRSTRNITTDEAISRHTKFCEKFRSSSPPTNSTEELISAMKQLLRRTLDSPRKAAPTPARPGGGMIKT